MQTLSYGFKKPETGDTGSVFFPALEDNITQLNDHNHDGTDSAKIPSSSSTVVTASVAAASWVATANGTYRQLLTIPAAITAVTDVAISFRDSTTMDPYYLKVEKVSSTTFYAYINDNSVTLTVVYSA